MKYLFFIIFHSSKINKTKNSNTQQMQQKYKTDSQKKTYIKLQFTLCLPSTQKFMIELNWVCCIKNFKARRRRRTHTLFLVCCVIFFFSFAIYIEQERQSLAAYTAAPISHHYYINKISVNIQPKQQKQQSKAKQQIDNAARTLFSFILFLSLFDSFLFWALCLVLTVST